MKHNEQPDYRVIDIPDEDETPPEEFHYTERRAQLLQIIEQAGHPQAVNKAKLGRRYGVSHTTINKDFKRLRHFITERIDEAQVDFITQLGFQSSIRELQQDGQPKEAAQVLKWWTDWLFDRGKIEKAPEKQQTEHSFSGSAEDAYMAMLEETYADGPPDEVAVNGSELPDAEVENVELTLAEDDDD